jgi:hypothetical protein
MTDLFERLGNVIKSEWNARFTGDPAFEDGQEKQRGNRDTTSAVIPPSQSPFPRKRTGRMDVSSAWRILELSPGSDLAMVRDQYQRMSQRYHPRTLNTNPDQAYTAQQVLDGLTEAVEILEEELLPLPPGAGDVL